jgi:hypothetical protein
MYSTEQFVGYVANYVPCSHQQRGKQNSKRGIGHFLMTTNNEPHQLISSQDFPATKALEVSLSERLTEKDYEELHLSTHERGYTKKRRISFDMRDIVSVLRPMEESMSFAAIAWFDNINCTGEGLSPGTHTFINDEGLTYKIAKSLHLRTPRTLSEMEMQEQKEIDHLVHVPTRSLCLYSLDSSISDSSFSSSKNKITSCSQNKL